jgi:hypothetical protein
VSLLDLSNSDTGQQRLKDIGGGILGRMAEIMVPAK